MGRMLSTGPAPVTGNQIRNGAAASVAPMPAASRFAFPTTQVLTTRASTAFYLAAAMIFVRMSVLPEILAYITGANTYLLYLIGPPALLAVLFTGGLAKVFRARAAYYWTAMFIWIILATPFSI